MVAVISWPHATLRARDVTYFLRHTSRSAGTSLSGVDQIVSSGSAVWEVSLTLIRLRPGARVREFEAMVAMMEGRLNIADIAICDPFRYGERFSPSQQPYADETWHSDGTGFVVPGAGAHPVTVIEDAPAGADMLRLDLLTLPARPRLAPGQMFSIDGFLYRAIWGGAVDEVRFAPRLRRPVAEGTVLQTDPPRFCGRLADDDQGRRAREMLRTGSEITLNFVEAFDRP